MAHLDEAKQRLQVAVNRLEAAIQNRVAAANGQSEIARLSEALATAQSEHARVQEVTLSVADKLDGTIERLRKILGEPGEGGDTKSP